MQNIVDMEHHLRCPGGASTCLGSDAMIMAGHDPNKRGTLQSDGPTRACAAGPSNNFWLLRKDCVLSSRGPRLAGSTAACRAGPTAQLMCQEGVRRGSGGGRDRARK
eukprot:949284-Prorocentrum_minimum.AAC.4